MAKQSNGNLSNSSYRSASGFRPLAQHLERQNQKIGGKRGFHDNYILGHWREIIGDELARITRPRELKHRRKDGAILVLDCVSAYTSELSMRADEMRMKINAAIGFNAIGHIQLHHQDTGFAEAKPSFKHIPQKQISPPKELAENITKTQNNELREALESMAQHFYNKGK